jgi:hypothetical protein
MKTQEMATVRFVRLRLDMMTLGFFIKKPFTIQADVFTFFVEYASCTVNCLQLVAILKHLRYVSCTHFILAPSAIAIHHHHSPVKKQVRELQSYQ